MTPTVSWAGSDDALDPPPPPPESSSPPQAATVSAAATSATRSASALRLRRGRASPWDPNLWSATAVLLRRGDRGRDSSGGRGPVVPGLPLACDARHSGPVGFGPP